MNVSRGDVVLVDFPFSGGSGGKVRPALVIQNNQDNQRLTNTIVAMITTRKDRTRTAATQLLIEVATPDGRQTGLLMDSAVNCANLFTVDQQKLIRVIGHLPVTLQKQVDECLKAAMDLR